MAQMDRPELRFRILFEYYDALHSPPRQDIDTALSRVYDMDIPDHERNAAMIWLIDRRLVEGRVIPTGNMSIPSIARINSNGISFVEFVMGSAFTKIEGKSEDFDKLSKTDKIAKFAKDCLKSPTTGQICQVTLDAVIIYMDQFIR